MRALFQRAHAIVWCALAIAFVARSAPEIYRRGSSHSVHSLGPNHSTDSFLRFTTDSPLGSERLMTLFAARPAAEPVLVFFNQKDARSVLLGMVSAYLSTPHPVRLIDSLEAPKALQQINSQNLATLVFSRLIRPKVIPAGKTFGDMEITSPPVPQ